MAMRTFTATRAVTPGDGKRLVSWHLSSGGTALVVDFCDGTSSTPIFQVQLPINASASQSYNVPHPNFPNGVHVQVVSGTLVRGAIDV